MPELAEIAIYAENLNSIAKSQKLTGVRFLNKNDWGDVIVHPSVRKLFKDLVGCFIKFSSAGKALHILKDGLPHIECRLGMTGQFHEAAKPGKWKRHYFFVLQFENQTVYYADPRRFGRIIFPKSTEYSLGGFSENNGFWKQKPLLLPNGYLRKPRISWLLGTGELTGIGNYMANEALGRLDLSPYKPCRSKEEAQKLILECLKVARYSFKNGGNSFGTGFYSLNGLEGKYAKHCKFYQNPNLKRQIFQGRPVFSRFSLR